MLHFIVFERPFILVPIEPCIDAISVYHIVGKLAVVHLAIWPSQYSLSALFVIEKAMLLSSSPSSL